MASGADGPAALPRFDLVKIDPGMGEALSFSYDLARFDAEEDLFGRGRPPFYLYKEQEEIPIDEAEEAAKDEGKGGRPRRQPRLSTRWTLHDAVGKAGGGLLYYGRSQAQPQGSAFLLMAQSRENKRQIQVMPVNGWIAYERQADVVEVPTSIKEAEQLMKKKSGAAAKKRKNAVDEEGEETQLLSRRQRIQKLLLKSLNAEEDEGDKKGNGKGKGAAGGPKRPSFMSKDAAMEQDSNREETMMGGLAQAEDTKELLGIGIDEENEDEYEFQDDEEDLADVNNALLSHELNEEDKNEEDEEEDDDEEEDQGAQGLLGDFGLDEDEDDGVNTLSPHAPPPSGALSGRHIINQMEARYERPQHIPQAVPPPGAHMHVPVGARRRADDAGGASGGRGGGVDAKRPKLSLEPGSLAATLRERLVGLGGRVKARELMPAVKDLVKDKAQIQAFKEVLSQLTLREHDPVDQGLIYMIRPEYAKK